MKINKLAKLLIIILSAVLIIGAINIFASLNPYTELSFSRNVIDYDPNGSNEYHNDVMIFDHANSILSAIYPGAWLYYGELDFGADGAEFIKIHYAVNSSICAPDSYIEIWINDMSPEIGTKVGTVQLPPTGDNWDTYNFVDVKLDNKITGVNTLYFILHGTNSETNPFIANLSTFEFIGSASTSTESPTDTTTPTDTTSPSDTIESPINTTSPPTAATTDSGTGSNDGGISPFITLAIVLIAGAIIGISIYYSKKNKNNLSI